MESELNSAALENSVDDHENHIFPTTSNEDNVKNELQTELSEFVNMFPKETGDESNLKHMKRKREYDEDDEDNKDILTGIYLRSMYPLSKAIDKTVTVGVFQSLDFQPAVLLNHCTKASILFSVEVWDNFTKYCSIVETFLQSNLTGKKTSIVLHDSDIEVDNVRLRGSQFVRFRNLTKHHKKILLSNDEFYVLSNLVPAITRYVHQLVTYGSLVSNYLNAALLNKPPPKLMYGSLDATIYNKLPHEVECFRRIERSLNSSQNSNTNYLVENVTTEESKNSEENTQSEEKL